MIHLIKGEILFEQDKYEEAYQWFATIPYFLHQGLFLSGPANYRMGMCQDKLGNTKEALAHFEYFIEVYQDCDEIYLPWIEETKKAQTRLFAMLK
jgi:tetratricopeptide (TPR) repeat protein